MMKNGRSTSISAAAVIKSMLLCVRGLSWHRSSKNLSEIWILHWRRCQNIKGKRFVVWWWKGHKIGSKVRYPEYISASTRNGYHDNPTVVLNILSKSGRDIREYNEQESEILFKRNSCFCVLNVKLQDGIFVLEMEEVLW